MAFDGSSLWLCDLFGGQLLRIEPSDGRIVERIGADTGIAPPDDIVVAPNGSLVYTSPQTGVVGRIRHDMGGAIATEVLARLEVGVNPIALTPDGSAVVVGFGAGDADRIDRIDLATGARTTVARGVPGLNGFSFGPDGALWAPAGGPLAALTGDGGVVRIDVATGESHRLSLTFPGEPAKHGLQFAVSVKWTPDGRMFALQGIGAVVYEIDATTGVATRFSTIGSDVGDNQIPGPAGHTFVSGFFGSVFDVDSAGVSTRVPLGAA